MTCGSGLNALGSMLTITCENRYPREAISVTARCYKGTYRVGKEINESALSHTTSNHHPGVTGNRKKSLRLLTPRMDYEKGTCIVAYITMLQSLGISFESFR